MGDTSGSHSIADSWNEPDVPPPWEPAYWNKGLGGAETEEHDPEPVDGPETLLGLYRAALVDSAGLDTIPEAVPLVTDTLYVDSLAWLQGKPANGKSFVALDLAGCVGTGTDWQDRGVTQGRVLFVAAEGVAGMRWRVRAWESSYGREMTGVAWLPMAPQAGNLTEWRALTAIAEEMQPALVVIDTQARTTVGLEENSSTDMGLFVHRLEALRKASGACVLVVHHQGRNGEHMRGSTALEGAADTVVQVVKDDELLTIKCAKQKNASEFEDIALKLTAHDRSAVLTLSDGRTKANPTAALATARKWWEIFTDDQVSASKLLAAEVATERTFYRHVRELMELGFAAKEQAGRVSYYQLTRDPRGTE